MPNVYARTMKAAAELSGGDEQLARRLGVSTSSIHSWCAGCGAPPLAVLLKATDLLITAAHPETRSLSRALYFRAALWRLAAIFAMQKAR